MILEKSSLCVEIARSDSLNRPLIVLMVIDNCLRCSFEFRVMFSCCKQRFVILVFISLEKITLVSRPILGAEAAKK